MNSLLTIAGTDPSGGAGIQVDLQVFRDFGCHGLSAITAIVWQNTVGVRGFEAVDPEHVRQQIEAVVDDIPVAGIKIGMLASSVTAEMLAGWLQECDLDVPVVLDPVLAAGGGEASLHETGILEAVGERLLPEVDCLTPNIPEAEALLDVEITDEQGMFEAAETLWGRGAGAVVLKAGHLASSQESETINDVLATGDGVSWLTPLDRIEADVRGTGCQLSSAICAELSRAEPMREAVESARLYLNRQLRENRLVIGRGRPVVVRAEEPT